MVKKEKPKDAEDLSKLRLPPMPKPEDETEKAKEVEEPEATEGVKERALTMETSRLRGFEVEETTKNGRLDQYDKELSILLEEKDASKTEAFMFKLFSDCMNFLKDFLHVDFPDMMLKIIYKKEEYDALCGRLDRILPRPWTKATVVSCGSQNFIYIDFDGHFKGKPIDFIANLSISYLEELIHVVYPTKKETEIQEVVCSAIEKFLEVRLPENIREERLKRSRNADGNS